MKIHQTNKQSFRKPTDKFWKEQLLFLNDYQQLIPMEIIQLMERTAQKSIQQIIISDIDPVIKAFKQKQRIIQIPNVNPSSQKDSIQQIDLEQEKQRKNFEIRKLEMLFQILEKFMGEYTADQKYDDLDPLEIYVDFTKNHKGYLG
ncbi:UNKNOWN [Stylonychia lemnae]|uniref:Uncharacterized protein n=1 Tax=Stylonychia lemnae TaxID=5949 RepID=A0A077ZTA8_STYLE|nr:UNKNOWN [Stylonychia lemnae]|eukprot:CDW73117.1 UNKNOWN [Stylonychia lemnae]